MKKLKVLVIFSIMIFQILCTYTLNVYGLDINFKNIKVEDGLSQSTVEAIYQDSKGYIWIGTNDGLNKYNGHEFEVYRHNTKSENSIANNYIVDIKEDKKGNIWVGTAHGVSKIDGKSNKITNYYEEDDKGNLSHNNIGEILITDKNDIIIGTTNGVNLYDEEQDKFERILEKELSPTSQYIYSMTLDDDDNLWISTKNGLNKVEAKNNKVKYYKNSTEDENTISSNKTYEVYYDDDGYIWLGTIDKGLNKIDIETDEITRYISEPGDNTTIPENHIRDIFKDKNNTIWIGTDNGLAKLNEDNKTFTTYKSKSCDQNGLVDDEIKDIIQDKSGLIWIGTYSGISIFNPENTIKHYKTNPTSPNGLIDNVVHGIYEDDEGYLWVGTNSKGLNIINTQNDNIYHLNKENSNGKLSDNRINDIVGRKEEIYIATNNGVNVVNKDKKTIEVYNTDNGLTENIITSIFVDSKNNLWVGLTNGVNIINLETKEIIDLTKILEQKNVSKIYTKEIYEDSEGVYWLGCFINNGLIKIDPKEKTIKTYKYKEDEKSISSNTVRYITEDLNNDIWIGTSYGINKFDRETETFISYIDSDGLSNNIVYGILPDDNNNLWISTNNGLSMFNTEEGVFRNFGITDGLQGNEFNGNASYKNKDGILFFGGINGLNAFEPSQFQKTNYAPPVKFDDITVNGVHYNSIDNKVFEHDENIVSIELFVPDYTNTRNITYYYMLEGVNKEWVELDSNYINNINLAPGDYTLKVKARNYNGVETSESKMAFKINPPFYKSNLAYLIYILIALLLVVRNKRKVKKLDTLVDKRTKQLRDEMKRNDALLNKVIKLEKSKNNYFINLSHELRTPLNVIYTTEQLITEFNKSDKPIEKDKLNEYMLVMRRNTKRLLGLINNLIDTAKIEQGKYKMILKESNIVSVVEEAALSLAQYVESKGIELIVDPEIEEKFIMCDEYEIERCIVNLISNAAKFTPKGGKIEVGIVEIGTKVKITVKDTGIGIEPKYHKHIFDRFNQIVDEKSEVKGGSGLGLTITKQIIDLHNGKIFVESEVGKGSTFTIII
ncbi:MAG: ligand-binding sensor domain-containing protein [Peptostreptococcaceae bacterium]